MELICLFLVVFVSSPAAKHLFSVEITAGVRYREDARHIKRAKANS